MVMARRGHPRVPDAAQRASGAPPVRDRTHAEFSNNPLSAAHHSASLHAALRTGHAPSPFADDLGQLEVVLGDALVGLPPVDIDVGEAHSPRLHLLDPLAGARVDVEVEIPAVEVPYDLLLALGRGEVERVQDRRV